MTPTEPRGGEGCRGVIRAYIERNTRRGRNGSYITDLDKFVALFPVFDRPSPPVVHGWPEREAVARLIMNAGLSLHATDVTLGGVDRLSARILALFPPVVGWQMVPVEPTEAMLHEAMYFWGPWLDEEQTQRAGRRSDDPADLERAKAVWAQMLAAAPLTDGVKG